MYFVGHLHYENHGGRSRNCVQRHQGVRQFLQMWITRNKVLPNDWKHSVLSHLRRSCSELPAAYVTHSLLLTICCFSITLDMNSAARIAIMIDLSKWLVAKIVPRSNWTTGPSRGRERGSFSGPRDVSGPAMAQKYWKVCSRWLLSDLKYA